MYIYKLTNTKTGLSYVGQTIQSVQARWKQHLRDRSGKLHEAIEEYGKDCWLIEILENVASSDLLNEREGYWINHFDTFVNGYNSTPDGLFHKADYHEPSDFMLAKIREQRKMNLVEYWAKRGIIYD